MRRILLFLLFTFICLSTYTQSIMSWNIQDLGKAKYEKDSIVPAIADAMIESGADIIAIQEVVLNSYGDSCIIQISKILNYNYIISNRTSGDAAERYAFIYRKDIKLDTAYLDSQLEATVTREPYIAEFTYNCRKIIVRQVHLVPATKYPEEEVKQLYIYKDGIICGDFNISDENIVFNKLYDYFRSPLMGQPTTLKRDGTTTNNSYDHFLVSNDIKLYNQSVFLYNYKWNRRLLSDHLPIVIVI
jgi:endonuclease/exonuclease/phosphatase family metal-dependent hydrolase